MNVNSGQWDTYLALGWANPLNLNENQKKICTSKIFDTSNRAIEQVGRLNDSVVEVIRRLQKLLTVPHPIQGISDDVF